jgi:large subunit ribosomal protein L14e
MFEVGRICLKTAGREAGKYCVVVKKLEGGFVLVTGPKALTKVKRRKCNIDHIEPLLEKVDIKSDASDEEVMKALKDSNILEKLGMKKPEARHEEKKTDHKPEHKHEEHKAEKKEEHKVEHKHEEHAEKKEEHKIEHNAEKKTAKKAPAKKAAKDNTATSTKQSHSRQRSE